MSDEEEASKTSEVNKDDTGESSDEGKHMC